MFCLIKHILIVLLSFSESSAIKCMFLINKPCIIRSTLIDSNPVELNYYPLMISLGKFNGSCNAADDLSTKMCVLTKRKGVNIKVFKMITRMKEAKTLIKHIVCHCKCKYDSERCNSSQISNNKKCRCEYKKYRTCNKDCSYNPL